MVSKSKRFFLGEGGCVLRWEWNLSKTGYFMNFQYFLAASYSSSLDFCDSEQSCVNKQFSRLRLFTGIHGC